MGVRLSEGRVGSVHHVRLELVVDEEGHGDRDGAFDVVHGETLVESHGPALVVEDRPEHRNHRGARAGRVDLHPSADNVEGVGEALCKQPRHPTEEQPCGRSNLRVRLQPPPPRVGRLERLEDCKRTPSVRNNPEQRRREPGVEGHGRGPALPDRHNRLLIAQRCHRPPRRHPCPNQIERVRCGCGRRSGRCPAEKPRPKTGLTGEGGKPPLVHVVGGVCKGCVRDHFDQSGHVAPPERGGPVVLHNLLPRSHRAVDAERPVGVHLVENLDPITGRNDGLGHRPGHSPRNELLRERQWVLRRWGHHGLLSFCGRHLGRDFPDLRERRLSSKRVDQVLLVVALYVVNRGPLFFIVLLLGRDRLLFFCLPRPPSEIWIELRFVVLDPKGLQPIVDGEGERDSDGGFHPRERQPLPERQRTFVPPDGRQSLGDCEEAVGLLVQPQLRSHRLVPAHLHSTTDHMQWVGH
eukprot:m.227600 g.227600  ORF g.227600 m.227600 type:complete len:465 (-) comp15662_c0_seq6:539-1933(-)